nr:MAG TPA: hypothetical protein [Caudoviricetes sp.]
MIYFQKSNSCVNSGVNQSSSNSNRTKTNQSSNCNIKECIFYIFFFFFYFVFSHLLKILLNKIKALFLNYLHLSKHIS